jgi:hypothetical protein
MFVYDLCFGLDTPMAKKGKADKLNPDQVSDIKLASERIRERTAPETVLNSTDRRTTNPKERTILFNYLKKLVAHA